MPGPQKNLAASVNGSRLWDRHMAMAEVGGTPRGGVHRLPFSAEDTASRRLLLSWAEARGFSAQMDDFANIFVRRAGLDEAAPPVMSGSHLDTQPLGGKFDGVFGVLAAFEALEALEDACVQTKRSVEAVVWSAEEADAGFGIGCLGSQVYADPTKLLPLSQIVDNKGTTVREALERMLRDHPKLPRRDFRAPISSYVEAHIEQGPALESGGHTIGIVTAIHGQRWFEVELFGEAGHAGNFPEKLRRDALLAAVQIIAELRALFYDPSDIVRFTIGRLEVDPNALAVIPGYVSFTIDFRHPDEEVLSELGDKVAVVAAKNRGPCEVKVSEIRRSRTTPFAGIVPKAILAATTNLRLPYCHIASGAGHDARYIAELCPTGMIFIPCWRGISHNELENASPNDVAAGARVLAETLLVLANCEF
jgi:N-carbamoyl-L-amino-acid hydrolase